MSDELDARWDNLLKRMDRMLEARRPSSALVGTEEKAAFATLVDGAPIEALEATPINGCNNVNGEGAVELKASESLSTSPENASIQLTSGDLHLSEVGVNSVDSFVVPHALVFLEENCSADLALQTPGHCIPECPELNEVQDNVPSPEQDVCICEESSEELSVHIGTTSSFSSDSESDDSDPTWEPGLESTLSSSSDSSRSELSDDSIKSLFSDRLIRGTQSNRRSRRTQRRNRRRSLNKSTANSESTGKPIQEQGFAVVLNVPATRRILRSYFVTEKSIKQHITSKNSVPIGEDLHGQRQTLKVQTVTQKSSRMGKEKETFEGWSVPRNRGKASTRSNATEDNQNKGGSKQGKQKLTEGNSRSSQPKGLKQTAVAVDVNCNTLDSVEVSRSGVIESERNGNNLNVVQKSRRRIVSENQLEDNILSEKVVVTREKTTLEEATAEFDNGSDIDISPPPSTERGLGKGSPPYVNNSRHEKNKEIVFSEEQLRSRSTRRVSPEWRKTMKSTQRSLDMRDASPSDNNTNDRRRSQEYDSFSSRSPDRNDKGKRPRHERRSRRSYDLSEEEFYYRKRDMERRFRRRYGGSGAWEYSESSRYGRRRHSRRSHSDDGSGQEYTVKQQMHMNSSEEEFKKQRRVREVVVQPTAVSPVDENAKRRERRQRQRERESQVRHRESQGLKGHYIAVDEHGEPYAYGIGAWHQTLNKLCRSLDPSVMDIRWQPEEDMKILRRRLKESFEYSAPISRAYIRTLAGRNVTQRRNKIISTMVDGADPPSGMDPGIWARLDRIRKNPRREELSQRMRNASLARRQIGRTGPKGISGVRDDLRKKLGREADPDELEEELRRDKGYGGRSKKKIVKEKQISSDSDSDENTLDQAEDFGSSDEAPKKLTLLKGTNVAGENGGDKEHIRSLERKILELEAKNRAAELGVGSLSMDGGGPSNELVADIGRRESGSGTTTLGLARRADEVLEAERNENGSDKGGQLSPAKKRRKGGRR